MTAPVLEPGATALSASGLRIGYGGKTVVDDISLTIDKREIVCLLGGSGCGKSTLLRGLAGLSPAQSGNVSFLGEPLLEPHPRAALVFQQPSLLPWLNVEGNVGFGLDFARQPAIARDARKQRVVEAIEAVGLAARAHAYPAQLSGGQAQRVALARALARQPELLFADEPFSALDAITRAEMQTLLESAGYELPLPLEAAPSNTDPVSTEAICESGSGWSGTGRSGWMSVVSNRV